MFAHQLSRRQRQAKETAHPVHTYTDYFRTCKCEEARQLQYQGGLPWDFKMVLVGHFVLRRGVGLALIKGVASGELEGSVLDISVFTDSLR